MSETKSFSSIETPGYVGFANLPNQVHRKSVKKGFEFTLMVVGESGLGKSTLVNSLFLTDLYPERIIPDAIEKQKQTVKLEASTVEIEERGVKLRLTVVDTPGFGDAIDNGDSFSAILEYIDEQYERFLRDESGLNRRNIVDNRIHCCFYFISPFGHGLKPLDVEFMKKLHSKVNIVPVIAKIFRTSLWNCHSHNHRKIFNSATTVSNESFLLQERSLEGCDYVCKNEKALNDHIRHKHRLLSCEYCQEQFTRQKLTAHLRKIHRAEIDVELAGESDNYYKSQLLNNNNDITQISFNLLNTQQQQTQQQQQQQTLLTNNSSIQLPPSSSSLSLSSAQTLNAVISNSSSSNTLTTTSALSPINTLLTDSTTITSSSSAAAAVSLTSCLTPTITTKEGTNLITNTTSISTHNLLNDVDHHDHDQLCAMFATDHHDSNTNTTLGLNGLVSSEHDDLNLVNNDATNMFLVPTTSSTSNDNQLDQYFMASLIDTEQEIIVT
ncbi:sporulation-regulated protein 28 [Lucilia cuprina]|uniref:sporulation-regulated protein 28 n=1 Tax=Lucilia cuprina TaxID=7375 RepID=UPI001F06FA27|nr:sporulation-regulated protein 28 [Lucilia cuprina]